MANHTVFTLGHSTLPLEVFTKILAENGIRTLVDIRTIPKSRHNPQFAQEALSAAMEAQAREYHWLPSLGGLRKPRKELVGVVPRNAGWRNASFRGYADYMQTPAFSWAIEDLMRLTAPSDATILCAEAVPWRCHRSLVSDALIVRGIRVEHILYDKHGTSHRQPHQLTPFACVEGDRIWYPEGSSLFGDEAKSP